SPCLPVSLSPCPRKLQPLRLACTASCRYIAGSSEAKNENPAAEEARMMDRIPARAWFRPVLGLGTLGTMAFGIGWLFGQQTPPAMAQPPPPAQTAPVAPPTNPDYSNRVVAYIYGTTAITREELGEYLIARYGSEKLELLINKRIIEHACQERGIEVTA